MADMIAMIKDKIKSDEVKDELTPRFGWDNPKYVELETPVRDVMSAYQNANRWLDTLKEQILIDYHCPYFSHIVHELAHTMPQRFDKFGQILHKENLLVPYPSTEEWRLPTESIFRCIEHIFDFLDNIKDSLCRFKVHAESLGLVSFSIACDELVLDICSEYEFFIRVQDMCERESNIVQWDKQIYLYWREFKNLI